MEKLPRVARISLISERFIGDSLCFCRPSPLSPVGEGLRIRTSGRAIVITVHPLYVPTFFLSIIVTRISCRLFRRRFAL